MQKIISILLLGSLSMLFAEVFSGSSQSWFIDVWGILITFPLYLAHVLFFLIIALKIKKISLTQLYFFGVMFALYESWIAKVLWAGYIDASAPAVGTIFGISTIEFPVLVFFWHPIMSFILPIIVFEILSGNVIVSHESLLKKSTKKTVLIIIFLLMVSAFIANGNQLDLISANLSVIGTFLIVGCLWYLLKRSDLQSRKLTLVMLDKIWFIVLIIYLVLLYIITFIVLLPERIPTTVIPYIPIIFFYALSIGLIYISKKTEIKFNLISEKHYSIKELMIFGIIIIVGVNIYCLFPSIHGIILVSSYFVFVIIGLTLFIVLCAYTIKKKFNQCHT